MMTIINAIVHFFELYPDLLIVPVALAHATYGWLTEGDLFTTIAQGLVGAAIGFVFAALFTLFFSVRAALFIILIYFIYLLFQAKKERDDPYNW